MRDKELFSLVCLPNPHLDFLSVQVQNSFQTSHLIQVPWGNLVFHFISIFVVCCNVFKTLFITFLSVTNKSRV